MSHDLNKEHIEFEEYLNATKHREMCAWHPTLFRYTRLSTKQLLWETWLAARGVPYKWIAGLE